MLRIYLFIIYFISTFSGMIFQIRQNSSATVLDPNPATETATVVFKNLCPEIKCKPEYHISAGNSLICPKCIKTPTTTKSRICHPPNCPELLCTEGYIPTTDPYNCACPTCQPKPKICPVRNCPQKICPVGYKPVRKGCECPICELVNQPGKDDYHNKTTKAPCKKHICPRIECPPRYELVVDPTGCKCPKCRCIPRACPLIATICDPKYPLPPVPPCGCSRNCVFSLEP